MPKVSANERQWRAQDALRTLTQAQEIQRNPTLMRDVKKVAAQQVKTLSSVAGAKAPARAASKKR
jgi:recombinational DNA repair protein (RecF pathway)